MRMPRMIFYTDKKAVDWNFREYRPRALRPEEWAVQVIFSCLEVMMHKIHLGCNNRAGAMMFWNDINNKAKERIDEMYAEAEKSE